MKEAKKSHYKQFKFYEPHYLNIIKETFVWLFYYIECVLNSVREMKLMPPFFLFQGECNPAKAPYRILPKTHLQTKRKLHLKGTAKMFETEKTSSSKTYGFK